MRIPSGRILYTSTKVSWVRLGEMSPISFIADLPDVFSPVVASRCSVRGGSRTTSRKLLGNNRYCIYLQQQLRSRQSDYLDHGAGRKIGSQKFPSRFVYVAVITDIGGEYVHGDDVVDCATGSLYGSFDLLDHITRPRAR